MIDVAPEYDVIIIGGGITGAGTARDCAMRGLRTLLIERGDIATGATGRNHGLLHSGARYAVTDRESAAECIKENLILKKIARHCVDDTSGFFLTLPDDDLDYQKTFVKACQNAGIKAEVIDPEEARRAEPSVNPAIVGAVRVPDGSVDPFRLCSSNIVDAKLHGAHVRTYTEVIRLQVRQDTVEGVEAVDLRSGEKLSFRGRVIVNACGIWGHHIASLAGVNVGMFPAKGSLLVFAHRVNNIVLNRCRKPANADILVPGDTVCVIGTTSDRVRYEECDHLSVTPEEVDLLLGEGMKLAPVLAQTRVLRAYAGVRPLVSADNDPSGRNISRGIVCLDHEKRDGLKGFVTITGGKLMTYRLMAEQATDMVCRKLHRDIACQTATTPLPGSEKGGIEKVLKKVWPTPTLTQKALLGRAGALAGSLPQEEEAGGSDLVCECEQVSVSEVDAALKHLDVHTLTDLRRRTRVGMGTCQGELCSCRAAARLARKASDPALARTQARAFIEERWRGIVPVAWGETLREASFTEWVYAEVLGLDDTL